MVEKIVAPSELHLKKELTALQKARFLRDPETCSRRSPPSSKSVSVHNLYHDNAGEKSSSGLHKLPRRHEKRRKEVYLCNWKKCSSISGESGMKLDGDENQSVGSSFEDELNCNIRGRGIDTPARSSATRLRKSANSKRRGVQHSLVSKQMNLPISPLGALSSIEQYDDTEHCNSEDAQDLEFDLLCRAAYQSSSASPLFPGSGCDWSRTCKLFKGTRREGSSQSCTPASTSSYYRKITRKHSTVGSCSGTTASFEGDGFDQLGLPVRQGCGIPCYRSMKNRDKGCTDFYSPALSDTRKKGSCIFGRRLHNKQRPTGFSNPKFLSTSSKGLPLLTNNCDDTSSDELSTNLGEIELEALSRLDGRRWSRCKSQEAFEPGERSVDNAYKKSLNLMHKPRIFDEIVGQNFVVQSLMSAILRGRIAPAYLFHGPPGTGKKSTARIFAAALNCVATEGNKPCYLCKECTAFYGESGSLVRESSAANKKSIERVGYFLKNMTMASRQLRYRIFIIDECHLLSSKMWHRFQRFLEKSISHVVFIFITVDHELLPRAIISRVQKYLFSKIRDADIKRQLRRLAAAENLDIEMDALSLIAVNVDGSLQHAETMLYQLSALGKKITTSLVNDLVGAISNEKLLDLLEVAMASNTSETVRRSRELMDSGVDPMSLLSQLAGLIMDIIGGTKQLADSQYDDVVLRGWSLTEYDLKRLEKAVKILSDAEKQLKHSSEHFSLVTMALLQLAPGKNMEPTQPNTSAKTNDDIKKCSVFSNTARDSGSAIVPSLRSRRPALSGNKTPSRMFRNQDPIPVVAATEIQSVKRGSSEETLLVNNASQNTWNLSEIWRRCIEKCYSKTLRQLLSAHGKLISLTENEGILIAFISFAGSSIKLRAERYSSSITNLFETVLKQKVLVRLGLIPDNRINFKPPLDPQTDPYMEKLEFPANPRKIVPGGTNSSLYNDKTVSSRKIRDAFVGDGRKELAKCSSSLPQDDSFQSGSSSSSSEEDDGSSPSKEKGMEITVLSKHAKASNKLENAWMEAAENGRLFYDPSVAMDRPLNRSEDEQNHEIKALKLDVQAHHSSQVDGDKINSAISPSLLHSNSFVNNLGKENSDYESGPGCSGIFCCKANKPHSQQARRGVHFRLQKASRILFCGQRVKSRLRRGISRR